MNAGRIAEGVVTGLIVAALGAAAIYLYRRYTRGSIQLSPQLVALGDAAARIPDQSESIFRALTIPTL